MRVSRFLAFGVMAGSMLSVNANAQAAAHISGATGVAVFATRMRRTASMSPSMASPLPPICGVVTNASPSSIR